jgi:hypothetical protein
MDPVTPDVVTPFLLTVAVSFLVGLVVLSLAGAVVAV